jgi:hypothetical protein
VRFHQGRPELNGGDFYAPGTAERKTWRNGLRDFATPEEVLNARAAGDAGRHAAAILRAALFEEDE